MTDLNLWPLFQQFSEVLEYLLGLQLPLFSLGVCVVQNANAITGIKYNFKAYK